MKSGHEGTTENPTETGRCCQASRTPTFPVFLTGRENGQMFFAVDMLCVWYVADSKFGNMCNADVVIYTLRVTVTSAG